MSLRCALDFASAPLARAAAAFVEKEVWIQFGHARIEDHARERFGRSGRWVRDLAALGRMFSTHPGLEAAVCGTDGGAPIGRVAGLLIGRVASAESFHVWVSLARSLSVRELREVVAAAREAGSAWPPGSRDATANRSTEGETAGGDVAARDFAGGADTGGIAEGRAVLFDQGAAGVDRGGVPASKPADDAHDDDDAARSLVRLELPSPALAAFDEAIDLFRAIEGHEASVTSFVEALVAEAAASSPPPASFDGAYHEGLTRGETIALRERALARSTNAWEHLPAPGGPQHEGPEWVLRLAALTLERLRAISLEAGRGAPHDLDAQLRELVTLEDEIERRLAALMAQMADEGAWQRLRFDSAVHYAEQRLGLGRTATRMRMRVVRALMRLPATKRAYEAGAFGTEAAWLISKMAGRLDVDRQVEQAWIERARIATVKRLRDEARILARRLADSGSGVDRERPDERDPSGLGAASPPRVPGSDLDHNQSPGSVPRELKEPAGIAGVTGEVQSPGMEAASATGQPSEQHAHRRTVQSPGMEAASATASSVAAAPAWCRRSRPVSDAEWHAGLYRAVGTARERIARLGRMAASRQVSDVFLRLRFPTDLALDFLGAIESARRRLEQQAGEVPWEEPWPDPDPPGSLRAAREFFVRSRRTPAWVGLLALLEDFVETWDVDHARSRRAGQFIHERSGWRCSAPGCTSRRNLENHHIEYSGRGGSDEYWNRVSLCRFHHQCGEHGNLARVRGRAPLGLHWRLGRSGCGGSYRNDIKLGGSNSGHRAIR